MCGYNQVKRVSIVNFDFVSNSLEQAIFFRRQAIGEKRFCLPTKDNLINNFTKYFLFLRLAN